MTKKEIFNIKDKDSQEILLYLQRKNNKNKKIFFEEISPCSKTKNETEENNENLPPTRMKHFLTNSFIPSNANKPIASKTIPKEEKELTTNSITPKFNLTQLSTKVNIISSNKKYNSNSQFSFSEKNNNSINNKSVNYLDFNLHENVEAGKYKNNDICHLYLPKKYKDDEKYKTNLYKFLKVENRNNNILRERGNKTKVFPEPKSFNFDKIEKIKKILSVKKRDVNKIIFFDKCNERAFDLFKDKYIGIDKEWQLPVLYHQYDNDVDSDEEQISRGKDKMMYDLKLGIIKWSQNKNACFNYRHVKDAFNDEYVKKYCSSV